MKYKKPFLALLLIVVSAVSLIANEMTHFRVYLINQYTNQTVEIYRFKRKEPNELIFSCKINKNKIYNFQYSIPTKGTEFPFEFWVFIKGSLNISGRWVRISTKYEPSKSLVIAFSPQMKRKYCYISYWNDEKIKMQFR